MKSLLRLSSALPLQRPSAAMTPLRSFFIGAPTSLLLQQQQQQQPAAAATTAAGTSAAAAAAAAMYKSSRSNRQRGGGGLPSSNKGGAAPSASTAGTPNNAASSSSAFGGSGKKALDADSKAAADLNCDQETPAERRPLSALQKRQLAMRDKKVFTLTSRAVDRVNLLLNLHNDRLAAAAAKKAAAEASSSASSSSSSAVEERRAVGIRVGVKKKGCSGYSYTVNYEFNPEMLKLKTGGDALVDAMINGTRAPPAPSSPSAASGATPKISLFGGGAGGGAGSSIGGMAAAASASDVHVDQDGVHIFVEGSALFYVIGTVMDYTVSNVEEKFTFQNPNQAHSCGCGESFMPFGI